ncbi:MAG: tyrosine-type recombinase/integrase [Planctomycetota bacterium]
MQRILEAAPRTNIKLAIGIMYSAGLRNSEVCRLRYRDLDFDRGIIRIQQGKGAADRTVMLPQTIAKLLAQQSELYSGKDYLFPTLGSRTGRHMSPRTLQRWVTQAVSIAGIKKRVTPHSFRHAFATHLLESGIDIRQIQKLLGHQRLETTTIYTRVAKERCTRVTSPLDKLDLNNSQSIPNQASESQSKRTPSGSGVLKPEIHLVDQPVGKMKVVMESDSSQQRSRFRIEITGKGRGKQVVLNGIKVSQNRLGWIQIDLPTMESWSNSLSQLSKAQKERIESPQFYEQLRDIIAEKFLAQQTLNDFP